MLTTGAQHVVTGSGQFAIAQPVGLVVAISGVPTYVARDGASPLRYKRFARITLGHALGWQPSLELEHIPQLVYPLAPEFTLLAYQLLAGETATIDELVAAPTLNASLMPWDRHPVPVNMYAFVVPTGPVGSTVAWTYTVPTGKLFMLTHGHISVERLTVATTIATTIVKLNHGATALLDIRHDTNVAGFREQQDWNGAQILKAGDVLTGSYNDPDTGGIQKFMMTANGYEFDA